MRDPASNEVNGIPDGDTWRYSLASICMCTYIHVHTQGVHTDTHTHTLPYKQTSENRRVIGSHQQ